MTPPATGPATGDTRHHPAAGETEFTIARDRLDLWVVRSPEGRTARELDRSVLDDAERRRAAMFLRPADGLLYAAAHIALRRLLGRYLGVAADEVGFFREPCPGCGGPHGRPAVVPADPPGPALHFSLSHSGGLAVVGVAAVPVGVDVERLPGEETVEVCAPALHPGERAELAEAGGEARRELFGRLWTRKEAYLKGLGTGLGRAPDRDYLGADARRHPRGWTVLDVLRTPTHTAAAAVRGRAPAVVAVRPLAETCLLAGGEARAARPEPAPAAR